MCRICYIPNFKSWEVGLLQKQLTYLDKAGGGSGIGVGWINSGKQACVEKGTKLTVDDAINLMTKHVDQALSGFLFHTRIPSVGEVCDDLCMPFIFGGSNLFVYNGTWKDWKAAFYALLGRGVVLPVPPHVSDALVAAKLLDELGLAYTSLIDDGVVVIMTSDNGVILKKESVGSFARGNIGDAELFASALDLSLPWNNKCNIITRDELDLTHPVPEKAIGEYMDTYCYSASYATRSAVGKPKTRVAKTIKPPQRKVLENGWLGGKPSTQKSMIEEWAEDTGLTQESSSCEQLLLPAADRGFVRTLDPDEADLLQHFRWEKGKQWLLSCLLADETTFTPLCWANVAGMRTISAMGVKLVTRADKPNQDVIGVIPKRNNHIVILGRPKTITNGSLMFFEDTEDRIWARRRHWKLPIWVGISPAGNYSLDFDGKWEAFVAVIQILSPVKERIAEVLTTGSVFLRNDNDELVLVTQQELLSKSSWDKWNILDESHLLTNKPDDLFEAEGVAVSSSKTPANPRPLLWECVLCGFIIPELSTTPCPLCGNNSKFIVYDGPLSPDAGRRDTKEVLADKLNTFFTDTSPSLEREGDVSDDIPDIGIVCVACGLKMRLEDFHGVCPACNVEVFKLA